MHRCFVSAIFSLSVLPGFIVGAPIQLLDGVPGTYVPGQPVAFAVRLPAMTNLGSYNIDLALESATGTAGADFYFDVSATTPASANYVFPSTANFFAAANVDSMMRQRITLTDFDFTGVDVVPGTNDRVANVVLRTAGTYAGHLSLFVDSDGLILDTPDVAPTPVPGFDELQADIAASDPLEIRPVPEPAALTLLILAAAGICLGRGRMA